MHVGLNLVFLVPGATGGMEIAARALLPELEALGRGVPVACSDLPVLCEVGGDLPRYFDPDDPRGAARAILAALEEPFDAAAAAARAARFSWDAAAEGTYAAYERAHTEPAQPEVGVRDDEVVQVVDRDHAPEAAGGRRGGRERVDEVAPEPGGGAREHELLAAYPLQAVGGADRQHDPVHPQVLAGGVAAHERREPHGGRGARQRGDQRPRRHLHPAGLARHEEDEVQPDVHPIARS